MSHALLAIQNTLQTSNIFIRSRETVLFTLFGKKKVTQFSGLLPISSELPQEQMVGHSWAAGPVGGGGGL